jgi:hypothetical protein
MIKSNITPEKPASKAKPRMRLYGAFIAFFMIVGYSMIDAVK